MVTRYVWQDQLRIAGELNASGILQKRFVYGTGVNVPDYMIYQTRKYFFVKDHRGSVNLVVDSETGEIKQKLRYSEWGEIIEDTNPGFQPFGFAGGLYDSATKLYRFGARDYDPEIGRWLSKDPIRFDGGDTNLYGYVLEDPINHIDVSGKNTLILIVAGGTIFLYYGIEFAVTDLSKDDSKIKAGLKKCQEAWESTKKAVKEAADSVVKWLGNPANSNSDSNQASSP